MSAPSGCRFPYTESPACTLNAKHQTVNPNQSTLKAKPWRSRVPKRIGAICFLLSTYTRGFTALHVTPYMSLPLVYLVVYDFGKVSREHVLLSRYPSQGGYIPI